MSSRKPHSSSSLLADGPSSSLDDEDTPRRPASSRGVRQHRSSPASDQPQRGRSSTEESASSTNSSERSSKRSSDRARRGGSSVHSRSSGSVGSLEGIDELETNEDGSSLARARDRLRSSRGQVPPTSNNNTPSTRSLGGRRTVSDASFEGSSSSIVDDLSSSRRSSRRRPPRATKSNDELDFMSSTTRSASASDIPPVPPASTDGAASSSHQRTPRRAPPSRSKSAGDSMLLPAKASASSADDRGRTSTKKKGERGSGRSRSRSKGARKRTGSSRIANAVSAANSNTGTGSAGEKHPATTDTSSSTVGSSSTRVRRKAPTATATTGKSLMGLSMLDDLNPRARGRGPRDAKSVGPELMSPPSRSKLSAFPQRKITKSQEGKGGISALDQFLNNTKSSSSKSNNKMSSSRSVGAMPTAGSSSAPKKQLRRRLKKSSGKSDEGSESGTSSSHQSRQQQRPARSNSTKNKARGHASLGSGLDFQSASNGPLGGYGGTKMKGRKPSSKGDLPRSGSGSSLEGNLEGGSLHVSDLLGGGGGGGKKNGSGSQTNTKQQHQGRMNQSLGDIMLKTSDLGSLAQQKEFKRQTGSSVASEHTGNNPVVVEPQDDIFSNYSWTTSRRDRNRIQLGRKLLNDTLRQGTLLKVFETYVRKSSS